MTNDDLSLLHEYARTNSEEAFATLVSRHVNLVYSVALRSVRDPHLAGEITQAVFIILARKADSLGDKTILPGWLCRTARYASANALTIQRRRQHREQEAFMQSQLNEPSSDLSRRSEAEAEETWNQISPLLDGALEKLGQKDHDALVLRFFENKTFAEVGATLGASEDAAKMRVNRAMEKLRKFFTKRGVSSTTAIIAGMISANSVQAAPVALAKYVTTVAIAKGAAASGSTLTLIKGALKIMAWTKAKTTVVISVSVLLTAGIITTVLVEKHIAAKQYTLALEPWSDAGAATPKAALQSLAWALTNDKFDRAQELMQWDEKGLAYAGDAKMQQQLTLMSVLAPALKDIASFRILSVEPTKQPNELIVKIEKAFKNKNIRPFAVTAKLRRVGNQWLAVGNLEYFESGSTSMLLPFTGSF